MLESLFSALLMYSRIPVPQVEWKEENRRYSLCFFPIVGTVTGGFFILWKLICIKFQLSSLLSGAVSMLIPIIITGGIHLDGFCDVSDAMASYAGKEKRLEIMKDSHIGAFAAIRLCAYLILQTAILSEIDCLRESAVIAFGFVLSRALSGLAAVTFKSAKKSGTLQDFVKPAHRNITVFCLAVWIVSGSAGIVIFGGISGIVTVISALAMFGYYRTFAYRNFGGITGDLSGWFLQMCEIVISAVFIICSEISEVTV